MGDEQRRRDENPIEAGPEAGEHGDGALGADDLEGVAGGVVINHEEQYTGDFLLGDGSVKTLNKLGDGGGVFNEGSLSLREAIELK